MTASAGDGKRLPTMFAIAGESDAVRRSGLTSNETWLFPLAQDAMRNRGNLPVCQHPAGAPGKGRHEFVRNAVGNYPINIVLSGDCEVDRIRKRDGRTVFALGSMACSAVRLVKGPNIEHFFGTRHIWCRSGTTVNTAASGDNNADSGQQRSA
jgi:hypothetical protein